MSGTPTKRGHEIYLVDVMKMTTGRMSIGTAGGPRPDRYFSAPGLPMHGRRACCGL